MPSKPDKFGMKFWLAVDVNSKYLVNGFSYLGKDETRPAGVRLADDVVIRLMEPFLGKGRNVTTDNFFTSLNLAQQLSSKKTSLVGTMNRIRRELPPSISDTTSPRYSIKLVSFQNVILTTSTGASLRKTLFSLVHSTSR